MPSRRDLPTTASIDTYELLYDQYNWSIREIVEHCDDTTYNAVRRELQNAGFDTAERNRGPVDGLARELWEMDPDELGSKV
ncbi:hypothetical protein [Halocalculus aciditolerans]|uniref:Uncharacterized protein n=1 Tax=Halocalculus aciditolerans TaxID=1383812 RepID=A0A830FBD7_9EURY|nr:hypothetical protein [Halocalculus aciditolerans]GGL58256.1 hypothetical protein GCM10009039_15610 [Halocalculus aciditolerans]